jgi:integrase
MSSTGRLTNPKTKRSYRTIPFDDLTAECLTNWRFAQERKRSRAGTRWSDGDALVFTTRYGTGINRNNLARMVSAACEDANLDRIVPYELRHTAITFQLDAGHESWQVADWAGTSERMIAEIYRHRLTRVASISSVNAGLQE